MHKKLYRYPQDSLLFGIGSGIGRYFDVDPVFVRLIMVVVGIVTNVWPAIILYVILFFVIPVAPSQQTVEREQAPKDVTPEREEPVEHSEPAEPLERMDSSQNM